MDSPPEATPRPARPVTIATVVRAQTIARDMVRVVLTGDALRTLPDLGFTDSYVKLRFGEAMRAYTIRSFDRDANELTIDFVVHGDVGLAGPWAASARPGDEISFVGPGGDWAPRPDADVHLLVGDESAIPAIGAALEALAPDARAEVFVEVASADHRHLLPMTTATSVTWVHRDEYGGEYGVGLVTAVVAAAAADWPGGDVEAFVHGNADMVRPLRRYLLRDRGLDRSHLSISGYWRTGHTDEAWRAIKRDFNTAMDKDD